jgi:hydroxyacylglutathione hydrolase
MNTPAYVEVEEVLGAERVADGLWLLAARPRHKLNVYVMGDVLVDAASRHAARRILRQVKGLGLRAHVLTHGHMDHMGSSHEICERLELPLLCGEGDVPTVESGGLLGLRERPWPRRLQHRLMAGPGHPVNETLKEGDIVAGFAVLEVPGHSPGHLAFWREHDGVLVAGDVVFGMRVPSLRPGLQLPPSGLTPDPITNLESARRLAALEPRIVALGHGPPVSGEEFQEFVAQARLVQ